MKLSQRRPWKQIILIIISLAVTALSISSFSSVNASSAEYIYLNARGNSMYPAVKDGDRVTIQLRVHGSLINVGDIVAYSTIATGMNPGYMWICHRVVEKYSNNGKWYFKTKGDNCSEADPWEVPEYWLLGKVVHIDHVEGSYVPPETSSRTEHTQATYPEDLLMIVGIVCLVVVVVALDNLKRNTRK